LNNKAGLITTKSAVVPAAAGSIHVIVNRRNGCLAGYQRVFVAYSSRGGRKRIVCHGHMSYVAVTSL
jgi:hypothetical protein